MTAVWPATLPRPARSDYEETRQEARIRSGADYGPPSYRRRTSSVAEAVSLSIRVWRADKAVFDRFWRDTTRRGVLPFFMPDPLTDGWPLLAPDGAPLLTPTGTPLLLSAQWLCLFGDSLPRTRPDGLRFRISFDIWVMP